MTSLVSTFYFDPCSNVSIFLTLALHTVHVDSVFVQVNGTALHVAAACGNTTIVTALLNWGIDLDVVDCVSYFKNINGWSPLDLVLALRQVAACISGYTSEFTIA